MIEVNLDGYNVSGVREDDEECLGTFWHQQSPGTTYWRCLVPARHLQSQALPLTPGELRENDTGIPYLVNQRGDVAVWQFLGDELRTKVALSMRDIHGTRTLMEVDDNYLKAAPYTKHGAIIAPWKKTRAEAGTGYSHEMHRMITPLLDGVICSTPYLADIYSDYNPDVFVCPNSIDPNDWDYPDARDEDVFRIVYYGSMSHIKDTPLVTKALKWASKQPGVEVWTVGFRPPDWSFEFQSVPWSDDLASARMELFRFDLGLAPLKGNAWTRCKSDVKALEYAVAGVLPLMSNEAPYWDWARDFPDLLLSDDQWEEAIRACVSNRDIVRGRARQARDWVLANRTIEKTAHLWKEAMGIA